MNELFRLLPNLLKEFEDNQKVREAVVFATWRHVAGESLAGHAVPLRLKQKHLTIAVANERWEKYLRDLSGQMIFKLNSALSQAAVTFIDFQVDEEFVKTEREKRRGKTYDEDELRELALEQVSPKLRAKADSIKDDELRYQFLLAAGSCLVRKERLKKRQ
jgi:hypothetical protein